VNEICVDAAGTFCAALFLLLIPSSHLCLQACQTSATTTSENTQAEAHLCSITLVLHRSAQAENPLVMVPFSSLLTSNALVPHVARWVVRD
jgi:hypothetical protein